MSAFTLPGLRRIRIVCTLLMVGAGSAWAGPSNLPSGFADIQLAGSLDQPVALAVLPGPGGLSPRILFAQQRSARVGLVLGSSVATVGTVPDVETVGGERGLLGITVDPDFPSTPYIYVHATDRRAGGHVVISRFTLTGDLDGSASGIVAFDPGSRYDLLNDLPDDSAFHNGGTVRFGPDGMLYVSLGDDSNACDAQLVGVPAGKILRLDASRLPPGPGGPAPYALLAPPDNPYATNPDSSARLVWVLGLRNPFRFHIDALTGDLHVADVGQDRWEELTRFAGGGENGGWPWLEGPEPYATCGGAPPASTAPIAIYDHSEGAAIVSAGVYRRPASGSERFPAEYDGNTFYIDYYAGFMRRLAGSGANWSTPAPVPGQPNATDWATGMNNVSDVEAIPDGSVIYVRQSVSFASQTGEIRKISYPQTATAPALTRAALELAPPRPTPSRGAVTLAWSQPGAGSVRLTVLDAAGRVVRTLENHALLPAGTHERVWDGLGRDGTAAAPGLYFVRLEVEGRTRVARIARLR